MQFTVQIIYKETKQCMKQIKLILEDAGNLERQYIK